MQTIKSAVLLSLLAMACNQKPVNKMKSNSDLTVAPGKVGVYSLSQAQIDCTDGFIAEFNSIKTSSYTLFDSIQTQDLQVVSNNQQIVENKKQSLSLAADPETCSPAMAVYLENLANAVNLLNQNAVTNQQQSAIISEATVTQIIEKLGLTSYQFNYSDAPTLGDLPIDQAIRIMRAGNALFVDLLAKREALKIIEAKTTSGLTHRIDGDNKNTAMDLVTADEYNAKVEALQAKLLSGMDLVVDYLESSDEGVVAADDDTQDAVDLAFSNIIDSINSVMQNLVTEDQNMATVLQAVETQLVTLKLDNENMLQPENIEAGDNDQSVEETFEDALASAPLTALRGLTDNFNILVKHTSGLQMRYGAIIVAYAGMQINTATMLDLPDTTIPELPTDGDITLEDFSTLLETQTTLIQNAVTTQSNYLTVNVAEVTQTVNSIFSSFPLYASSCNELYELGETEDGVYQITNSGQVLEVQCDFETSGVMQGGWTLILNYLHRAGEADTSVLTDKFPLKGSDELGIDESQDSDTWGHASNSLLSTLDFEDIRFYCKTSHHDRVVDFKTSFDSCSIYAQTGVGTCKGYESDPSTEFGTDDSSIKDVPFGASNKGDYALTDFPFYGNSNFFWSIGAGADNRWECNDFVDGPWYNTLHRVWVK